MAYIQSKKISAYPVVNRDTSVSGDIYSRHTSEEIFSGIVNKFMSSAGFVITQKEDFATNKPFAFNIHGYYFNVSELSEIFKEIYGIEGTETYVEPVKDDVIWARIGVEFNGQWKELEGGDNTVDVTPTDDSVYRYTGIEFIKCNTAEDAPTAEKTDKHVQYIWPLMIYHDKDGSVSDWGGTGWNVPYSSYIKFAGKDFYCDTIDGGDFDIKAAPTFADYTWLQIKAYVDAGKAAAMWNIGDTHVFSYNDETYNAIIYHFNGGEKLISGKDAGLILGTREQLATSQYMAEDGPQKYFSSELNTKCEDTIYSGLERDLKSAIEKWDCIVGIENSDDQPKINVKNAAVYIAAPACKEVGLENAFNTTENTLLTTFDYFKDSYTAAARRAKEASWSEPIINWWLRSPGKYNNYFKAHYAYAIIPKDEWPNPYGLDLVTAKNGVCPIFCM